MHADEKRYTRLLSAARPSLNRKNLNWCPGCGSEYPSGVMITGYGERLLVCDDCGQFLTEKSNSFGYFKGWIEENEPDWCSECGDALPDDPYMSIDGICRSCCRQGGLTDGVIGHINVYLVDQAYGGPEEGGWYYSCGDVVQSIPLTKSMNAEAIIEDLEEVFSNEGRPSINSVLSEGEYHIKEQLLRGKSWPSERPHYE